MTAIPQNAIDSEKRRAVDYVRLALSRSPHNKVSDELIEEAAQQAMNALPKRVEKVSGTNSG